MTCKSKTYGAEGSHPPEVISQDSEHRFVTDAQIEQWTNGTAGQGQYMAMMFRRSATVPDTPEGGSFSFPIPNGGQWTNTILPGIDPVFISTRFFTSDGKAPQQAVWSPPVLFVQHGSIGPTGPKGEKGDPGIQGPPGKDGINGADGVNGKDGASIVWLGEASSHPIGAVDGNSYYNTTDKKSYVFWDNAWYQMTIDGTDGLSGYSRAVVTLFQASTDAENPPAAFTGTFTYTFATAELTGGTLNGWSPVLPAVTQGKVIWARQATAASNQDTDTIAAEEFSGAVVIFGNGLDGLNTATVTLYNKNTNAAVPPTAPSGSFTYSFITHLLEGGTLNGWTLSAPSVDESEYLWIIQATASSTSTSDTIEATEFSSPVVIAASGNNGLSIEWKGDLATPPADPVKNWVYRDTDNGIVYLYNGSAWELMVMDGSDGADGAQGIQGVPGIPGYTPVKGVDYFDGQPGEAGSDGDSAYQVWLNEGNIGSTADFLASLIGAEGPQGRQGIPGNPGKDGITTYTWVKYADSADGLTGFSNVPTGKPYIGFAFNQTTITESDNPEDYTWSLIKGDQGIQGPPGEDGKTTYTWIKYADVSDGTGLYNLPTASTEYIGIAVNKTSSLESENKTDYTWSKFKGDQGVQGIPGTTTYTWIKYADNAVGEGLSDSPEGKKYIGLAYNKESAVESTTASDYSWSLIKGDTGTAGQGIVKSFSFIRAASAPLAPTGGSFSSPNPTTSGWSDGIPSGTNPLYVSKRTFTSDGLPPHEDVWTAPVLFAQNGTNASGASVRYKFSTATTAPATGTGSSTYPGTGWTSTASSSTIWMTHQVNTTNHLGTVTTYGSWVTPIKIKGETGTTGSQGLSVYITYHDADPEGVPPAPPTNVAGDNNGWHTNATAEAAWISQKVDDGTGTGWGLAIRIRGSNGNSGPRGSNTFTIDESDVGSVYITPTVAVSWAGTLTNASAQAVARDIILTFAEDGTLRPNDKITVSDKSNQIAGTRIYTGPATTDYTKITASQFSTLVTQIIDGSLVVDGTVSVSALGADIVSGGKILGTLLEVTNAEIIGQIKSDAVGSTGLPMWEINKNGPLILRAANGTTILQSGGTISKNFITGLGAFAHVDKITAANIATYMSTAAIGEAFLGAASVGTLKIQENAVTVPVSMQADGTIGLSTTYATVFSGRIDSGQQPIHVIASCYVAVAGIQTSVYTNVVYALYINGSPLESEIHVARGGYSDPWGGRVCLLAEIPAINVSLGDNLVEIKLRKDNSNTAAHAACSYRRMLLQGIKR